MRPPFFYKLALKSEWSAMLTKIIVLNSEKYFVGMLSHIGPIEANASNAPSDDDREEGDADDK